MNHPSWVFAWGCSIGGGENWQIAFIALILHCGFCLGKVLGVVTGGSTPKEAEVSEVE